MTRTSQSTAFVMARASASSKSVSVGNCPQWMRTLEEKYQKLHKKITENTGLGHHRFNHQVGRSVYDCRLSHAIQKYREISVVKQNVNANSNPGKGDKQMTDCVINTADTSLSAQKQKCKQTEPNKLTFDDNVNSPTNKEMKNDHAVEHYKEIPSGNDDDCAPETSDQASTADKDLEDELDEALPCRSSDRETSAEIVVLHTKRHRSEHSRDINDHDEHRDVTKDRTYSRNVKTSLSRTSKVTSKSCPAKIQSRTAIHMRQPSTTLLSRSKSAHKNMFIQMSEEAKHAITETIHEMNLTGTTKPGKKEQITFVPTRTRKTIKTWAAPKKGRPDKRYDSLKVIEGATQKLERLTDDGPKPKDEDGDESCRSFADSSSHRLGSAILPEIQNDSVREHGGKNNSLRLPGIGKYDIRETAATFEITPPGFDSRYNDIAPVEERESETPPPDIRQKAIDKCSEWLTKYSK